LIAPCLGAENPRPHLRYWNGPINRAAGFRTILVYCLGPSDRGATDQSFQNCTASVQHGRENGKPYRLRGLQGELFTAKELPTTSTLTCSIRQHLFTHRFCRGGLLHRTPVGFLLQRDPHLPELLQRSGVGLRVFQIELFKRADDRRADHHSFPVSSGNELAKRGKLILTLVVTNDPI
jgi:hypothetical protein